MPAEPLRSKKPGGKGIWPGSSSFRGAEAGQLLVASFSRRCFRAIFGERGAQPPFLPGAAGSVCAGSALFAAKGLRHDEMQASPRKSAIWQRLGASLAGRPLSGQRVFAGRREGTTAAFLTCSSRLIGGECPQRRRGDRHNRRQSRWPDSALWGLGAGRRPRAH